MIYISRLFNLQKSIQLALVLNLIICSISSSSPVPEDIEKDVSMSNAEIINLHNKAAKRILSNLDETVNPCDDFYSFACGCYLRNVSIPSKKMKISLRKQRYLKMLRNLTRILESENEVLNSVNISVAKKLHKACKTLPILDSKHSKFHTIIQVFEDLNVLSISKLKAKNFDQFDLVETIHKLREIGADHMFLLEVQIVPRSDTDKRNILQIQSPGFSSLWEISDKNVTENKELYDETRKLLHKLRTLMTNQFNEFYDFRLVKAENYFRSLNGTFPLKEYLEGLLPSGVIISPEDEIRINHDYLMALSEILDQTPKRALAAYIFRQATVEMLKYFVSSSNNSVSLKCTKLLLNNFRNFEIAGLKTYFNSNDKLFVIEMMTHIENNFIDAVEDSEWIDSDSKIAIIDKMKKMTKFVGYPEHLIDISEQHWPVDNHSDFLKSMLQLAKIQTDATFFELHKDADVRKWPKTPSTFNAAYNKRLHAMTLPAAYLYSSYFNKNLPSYMNYGSIGTLIGHEMTHTFERILITSKVIAKKYKNKPKNSTCTGTCVNLYNGITLQSLKNYKKQYECFESQRKLYQGVLGNSLLEDIADANGLKIAYKAYTKREKINSTELPLPGLKYNARQLFWLASANKRCAVEPLLYEYHDHSPNHVRVLMPLSNIPEFSQDFNCSIGLKMNPEKKCKIL